PRTPTLSAPSSSTRGVCRGLTPALSSALGSNRLSALCCSGGLRPARASRAGRLNTAVIVLALLMWSVLTSEVSMVPGCWLATNCHRKLRDRLRLLKIRGGDQYWSPIVLDRFDHSGASGSFGGFRGCGPTWQKPHDMLMR